MSVLDGMRRDPDGGEFAYTDADGVSWRGLEDVLAIKVFGFCTCGAPDAALTLMRDAMRLIELRGPSNPRQHRQWFDEVYVPRLREVFGEFDGAQYVVWYLLEDKGLTEHGGSVPGWLTPKGHEVLADLEAYCADESAGAPREGER